MTLETTLGLLACVGAAIALAWTWAMCRAADRRDAIMRRFFDDRG